MDAHNQSGYQSANLNAGHHLDIEELNELHPLWSRDLLQLEEQIPKKVSFGEQAHCREEDKKDNYEKTDFTERGDKPLCKTVKFIEATAHDKSIYPIFIGENKEFLLSVDEIITDIIESLIKGRAYRVGNASSLRVSPSQVFIERLKKNYVKFRYFADLPPLPIIDEEKENRVEEKKKPLLVRQASRSIYCAPPPLDVLEQKYLKLLGR